MSVLQRSLKFIVMKKLFILVFGVILLSACDHTQKVSDDVDVYIIETAYIENGQATFFFRDVDQPFEVPLAKCEEVPLVKGTVVLIDDDLNVTTLEDQTVLVYFLLSMLFAFLIYTIVKIK